MFMKDVCDLCGDCLVRCHYVDYDQSRAQQEFKDLIEGGTPPIVTACVSCVACNNYCPVGANPFDLILERQEQTGILNIPEANLELFRSLPASPGMIVEGAPDLPALSLCSVGDIIPNLFDGPLFEGLTVLKGGAYFCAVGWIHVGKESPVRDNAQRVVDLIAETGKKEVVFYHDDCYALMKSMAPSYGIDIPFTPIHIFDYLLGAVRRSAEPVKQLGLKAAYQQPCASRYTMEKDEVLDELLEAIGVERTERRYDREEALCCGAPLMARDRERAGSIKEWNISDARDAGADAMAYLCPLCYLNLNRPAGAAGLSNYHVIELVKMALGERPFLY